MKDLIFDLDNSECEIVTSESIQRKNSILVLYIQEIHHRAIVEGCQSMWGGSSVKFS